MKRKLAMVILLILLLPVGFAAAQEADEAEGEWGPGRSVPAANPPGSLAILDLLGKLTIAVLVAYGLAHGARWLQQQGIGRRSPTTAEADAGESALRLEQTLSLGADGRLYLVSFDGRRVLLAARDGTIQRIDPGERNEEPAAAVYRAVRQRPSGPPDELNIAQSRLSTRPVRSDVVSDAASCAERRDQLLRQLQDS